MQKEAREKFKLNRVMIYYFILFLARFLCTCTLLKVTNGTRIYIDTSVSLITYIVLKNFFCQHMYCTLHDCTCINILQRQARRVYEILRLKATDMSDKEQYKSYRLDMKKRLNAPFQVNAAHVLIFFLHICKGLDNLLLVQYILQVNSVYTKIFSYAWFHNHMHLQVKHSHTFELYSCIF